MNIYITGHTSGVGEIIHNGLPGSIGLSRSNGFDITKDEQVESLLDKIEDADVFINNAFSVMDMEDLENPKYMFCQTELLYKVYKRLKNKKTLIINIGSNTTHGVRNKIWPYSAAKASLEKACEQLCYDDGLCDVSLLTLGFVETDRIQKSFPDADKLQQKTIVSSITYIMENFKNNVKTKELCIIP